jgi:hypothetical protein
MSGEIVKKLTPEEEELLRKREELAGSWRLGRARVGTG